MEIFCKYMKYVLNKMLRGEGIAAVVADVNVLTNVQSGVTLVAETSQCWLN